jgi:CheY-like chemotaxis protein
VSRKKYILLVEDNRQDEVLTLRALREHGIEHEVIICHDGAEALDWIHARGKFAGRDLEIRPVVTLVDIHLPKIDGLEVLREIRGHPQTTSWPVVMLTSSKEQSDIAASYHCGANSFVQKPIDAKEFSGAIKNLGIYWLILNQPPEKI